jgi:hypothetical protein
MLEIYKKDKSGVFKDVSPATLSGGAVGQQGSSSSPEKERLLSSNSNKGTTIQAPLVKSDSLLEINDSSVSYRSKSFKSILDSMNKSEHQQSNSISFASIGKVMGSIATQLSRNRISRSRRHTFNKGDRSVSNSMRSLFSGVTTRKEGYSSASASANKGQRVFWCFRCCGADVRSVQTSAVDRKDSQPHGDRNLSTASSYLMDEQDYSTLQSGSTIFAAALSKKANKQLSSAEALQELSSINSSARKGSKKGRNARVVPESSHLDNSASGDWADDLSISSTGSLVTGNNNGAAAASTSEAASISRMRKGHAKYCMCGCRAY